MMISLIAAVAEGGGIGFQGRIPWRLSTDLRRFKTLTMGHFLVMGRKTCESIGKVLPGRTSIVVTRNPSFSRDGYLTASSLESALNIARQTGESEVFVIGGGEIFTKALPMADRLYLTKVHARVEADTFFPIFNETEWLVSELEEIPAGDMDSYATTFVRLEKEDSTGSH
jgi:dihydrofolate reductase